MTHGLCNGINPYAVTRPNQELGRRTAPYRSNFDAKCTGASLPHHGGRASAQSPAVGGGGSEAEWPSLGRARHASGCRAGRLQSLDNCVVRDLARTCCPCVSAGGPSLQSHFQWVFFSMASSISLYGVPKSACVHPLRALKQRIRAAVAAASINMVRDAVDAIPFPLREYGRQSGGQHRTRTTTIMTRATLDSAVYCNP